MKLGMLPSDWSSLQSEVTALLVVVVVYGHAFQSTIVKAKFWLFNYPYPHVDEASSTLRYFYFEFLRQPFMELVQS